MDLKWIKLITITKRLAIVLVFLSIKSFADGTGLQTSVSGDVVGAFGDRTQNRLDPREAEFMFYAPSDHFFDAVLSGSAHNESGQFHFELHEAYVGSSRLIPRARFRLGQFFLGIGHLNQFDRHYCPFITAPKVHQTFLAPEGVIDSGVEYSYLLPTQLFLEATVGVTNGWVFGHSHVAGSSPFFPTTYLRLLTYFPLHANDDDAGVQVGTTVLTRKTNDAAQTWLLGLDATAKFRKEKILTFFLQSEFWYRKIIPKDTVASEQFGFYIYPQMVLWDPLYLGVRFDFFNTMGLKDVLQQSIRSFELGIVPTLVYKVSEFTHFKAAYSYLPEYYQNRFTETPSKFEIQAVFILGAHPAHDF